MPTVDVQLLSVCLRSAGMEQIVLCGMKTEVSIKYYQKKGYTYYGANPKQT